MKQNLSKTIFQKSMINISKKAPLFELARGTVLDKVSLYLSPNEARLFSLVKETISFYEMNCTARVAGGWVRDKILGINSHDIDINVDTTMGVQFAHKMRDICLNSSGTGAENGKNPKFKIGCIKENPQKSKNLETATFRIFGISVDVNNLRCETYDEHSRIPQIKIGTVEEDALRRDFTLNTLFYNINKGVLEDFTKNGVSDLLKWQLKTPLDPLRTFLDDPLRALRACRFASRFGFDVHEAIIEGVRNPDVKNALSQKVSRERFGIEIGKILRKSPKSSVAFGLMSKMQIFGRVLSLPEAVSSEKFLKKKSKFDVFSIKTNIFEKRALAYLERAENNFAKFENSEKLREVWLLSAILLPISPFLYKSGKRSLAVPYHVITDSLRLPKETAEKVSLYTNLVFSLYELIAAIPLPPKQLRPSPEQIVSIGRWVALSGGLLQSVLLLAKLPFLAKSSQCPTALEAIDQIDQFAQLIAFLGIDRCHQWTESPFYRGRDYIRLLKLSPSPLFDQIDKQQFDWRLLHPRKTRAECFEWLQSTFPPLSDNSPLS